MLVEFLIGTGIVLGVGGVFIGTAVLLNSLINKAFYKLDDEENKE